MQLSAGMWFVSRIETWVYICHCAVVIRGLLHHLPHLLKPKSFKRAESPLWKPRGYGKPVWLSRNLFSLGADSVSVENLLDVILCTRYGNGEIHICSVDLEIWKYRWKGASPFKTCFSLKTKVTFCSQVDVSNENWKKKIFFQIFKSKCDRSVQGLQVLKCLGFCFLLGIFVGFAFYFSFSHSPMYSNSRRVIV